MKKITISLSDEEFELLELFSKKEKITCSTKAKKIVVETLYDYDPEILITSMKNLHDKVSRLETDEKKRLNILMSLFISFMANWFTAHPSPENVSIAKKGLERRDKFIKEFFNNFSENTDIFETIIADIAESVYE